MINPKRIIDSKKTFEMDSNATIKLSTSDVIFFINCDVLDLK